MPFQIFPYICIFIDIDADIVPEVKYMITIHTAANWCDCWLTYEISLKL